MTIFVIFFFKCQVFGNFLTVKWQFSRGSALYLRVSIFGNCYELTQTDLLIQEYRCRMKMLPYEFAPLVYKQSHVLSDTLYSD